MPRKFGEILDKIEWLEILIYKKISDVLRVLFVRIHCVLPISELFHGIVCAVGVTELARPP